MKDTELYLEDPLRQCLIGRKIRYVSCE